MQATTAYGGSALGASCASTVPKKLLMMVEAVQHLYPRLESGRIEQKIPRTNTQQCPMPTVPITAQTILLFVWRIFEIIGPSRSP